MIRVMQIVMSLVCAAEIAIHAAWAEAGAPAHAQYRYHYISVDQAVRPDGFEFFSPAHVVDSGKVYGTLFRSDDPDGCFPAIGVWQEGRVRIVVEGGSAEAANNSGTVGGTVVRECAGKLALFRRRGAEPIPTPPNAFISFVAQLTDSGIAVISSFILPEGRFVFELYRRGHALPVDLGPGSVDTPRVSEFGGIIAGTYVQPGSGLLSDDTRAFRHLTSLGTTTFLQPRPTERASWGQAIHDNGDVLGYSFLGGSVVGVWRNRPGNPFQTYIVENTPELPTVSSQLLWNGRGLIVVTGTRNSASYIVPRPGLALNLDDLIDQPPAAGVGMFITDLNDRGDLLGQAFDPDTGDILDNFLLERIRPGRPAISTPKVVSAHRQALRRNFQRALHPDQLVLRSRDKVAATTR